MQKEEGGREVGRLGRQHANVYFVLLLFQKPKVVYELNAKVLCRHRDNLLYEAKIIAIEDVPDGGRFFTVHYQVWL